MASIKALFAAAFICSLSAANAARILGIFPLEAQSHIAYNRAILESLHAAGHSVTIVCPFRPETEMENFTYINSSVDNAHSFVGQFSVNDFQDMTLNDMMDMVIHSWVDLCYQVMNLTEIKEIFNSEEKLYDVLFVEAFIAPECFQPIAEKFAIPVIGTIVMPSWKLAANDIGLPNNPAVIPLEMSHFNVEMSFIERLHNLWYHIEIDYYHARRLKKATEKFYRECVGKDSPDKADLSMIFLNSHASLLPRATPANVIEIGGVHVKPAKPLPKTMQKFIDEAPHGVILFTLGSVVKASSISVEQRQAFLDAFSSVPQRIIWKYEEKIENLPKNIMTVSWLPQRDILEHPKVIAFMSHCGISGTLEAVMTGTPVVTMPMFADQIANAALLHHRGVGVSLDLQTVTKEKVAFALNAIINDTSYLRRMQELSYVFKDRPISPQNSVVYWTEYVIRHKGTAYLKALGTDMPLYKYLMLDIVALVFVILTVAIYALFALVRKIRSLIAGQPKNMSRVKKDT